MTLATSTLGIYQADIILRTAIIQAMNDIRANPWMLEYVFASLKYDSITQKVYGEKEIENAKKWFLDNDVPVFLGTRLDEATFPCVTIALAESSEAENTLGDVHYDVVEPWDSQDRPISYGPFTPLDYSSSTGLMTLPSSASNIFPGMVLLTRAGREHVIQSASGSSLYLLPRVVDDFKDATIRPSAPAYVVTLESACFKESYSIGCHTNGTNADTHLTYLHSVIVFILLKYRETLLEARGFERSAFSSADFRKDEGFQNEIIYSRFMSLSGFVRQYWPKSKVRKIDGVLTNVRPSVIGEDAEPLLESSIDLLGDRDMLDWNATRS